jgi:hypothetical protein
LDKRSATASNITKGRRSPAAERTALLRVVHAILGLVLIVAGVIKLYELGFESPEGDSTSLLLMAFSEAELLGGLWMLTGFDLYRTHPWVVALFVGLAATSLVQGLAGKSSCSCLGSLSVNPWYALILNLGAVAALMRYAPPSDWNEMSHFQAVRLVGPGLIALFAGVVGWQQGCLVTVAGKATVGDRPLEEAILTFSGDSGVLVVRTTKEGGFRLPFVRPGRYIVSISDGLSVRKSESSIRGVQKKKSLQRLRRPAARSIPPVLPTSSLWVEISKNAEYNRLLKF